MSGGSTLKMVLCCSSLDLGGGEDLYGLSFIRQYGHVHSSQLCILD